MPKEFGGFVMDGTSGHGLYPVWDASRYEHFVLLDVYRLFASGVGRALRRELVPPPVIIPWDHPGELNATARPVSRRDAFYDGSPVRNCRNGTLNTMGLVGLGSGSLVAILYTPGDWGPSGGAGSQGPGSASDEVLCHELVHALYQLKGLQTCRPASGPSQHFHIEEDILAIAITNVYSSETGRRLRVDHRDSTDELTYDGFAQSKKKNGLSEIFFALHEIPITRFCVYFRNCALALANVKATFNPFSVALT